MSFPAEMISEKPEKVPPIAIVDSATKIKTDASLNQRHELSKMNDTAASSGGVLMRTELHIYGGKKIFVNLDGYDRIRERSPATVNEHIREEIIQIQSTQRIRHFGRQDKEDISQRITELEHEDDIDRASMLFFSVFGSGLHGIASWNEKRQTMALLVGSAAYVSRFACFFWMVASGFYSSKSGISVSR